MNDSKELYASNIHVLLHVYYAYALIHTVFALVFHIMINFLPHLLERHWHGVGFGNVHYVGLIASLPHLTTIILAPMVGIVVERYGHSLHICLVCAISTVFCFTIMLYTRLPIFLPIVVLAVSQALLPVLTLAKVGTLSTLGDNHSSPGTAFGMVEVLDGFFSFGGSMVFGFLYDITGTYEYSLLFLFNLAILGVCLILFIAYKVDSPRNEEIHGPVSKLNLLTAREKNLNEELPDSDYLEQNQRILI